MDLDARMIKLAGRATALNGTLYRSAAPRYANSSDLLSGEGSRRYGARWNPVGLAAVYGSLTPQTALAEPLAHANYYQLPVHAAMPRTFVAIDFDLTRVLDLTDGRIRQSLAISQKRLLECDWRDVVSRGGIPISQQVGHAASQAGFEAILVPSAADPLGRNVVAFVRNLGPASVLSVVAADRLGGV